MEGAALIASSWLRVPPPTGHRRSHHVLYCHAARLVVEVDGGIHNTQRAYDAERDQVFAGYGLRVERISNDAVRERLPEVVQRIIELVSTELTTSQCELPLPSRGEGAGG